MWPLEFGVSRDLFKRQFIELTWSFLINGVITTSMFWLLVAPSFQQCASSGMCWRSYIQGFHLFHTKTDIDRHWRCNFPSYPFYSLLYTCLVGTHLSTWGLWRVGMCVLMPNADFLTTCKRHHLVFHGASRAKEKWSTDVKQGQDGRITYHCTPSK